MSTNKKGPTEIHFNFMLKASRAYHNGESPIVFRVIYRAQRKDVFTGLTCPREMWMKEGRMVNYKHHAASSINHQIHKILANAEHHFNRLKFKTLQDFLLKETSDLIIEDKGDNVFEGVAMPTAITFFINKPNPNDVNWEDLFVTNPISKKMKSNTKLLGDISKIQRGLEIGKDKTLKTKTKFQLITGEDIEKYNVKNIRFIDQETYDEFIKGDLDYFKKERVLIRETGSSITCVYLDKLLLSTRSLYSIIPNKGISPKFIIAVLCSKLTQFFYQSEFKADTDVFPKIRIAQVKKIPIKVISEKEQTPFINLVDKIISLKQQDKDSSEQEKKIDELVYKLYDITIDEVKIIETK